MKINCVFCGNEIEKISRNQKYCPKCKIKAKNKKARDKYKIVHANDVRKRNTKSFGRFSGLDYENSPEKIDEIKKKYKNGITKEMIEEMVYKFI